MKQKPFKLSLSNQENKDKKDKSKEKFSQYRMPKALLEELNYQYIGQHLYNPYPKKSDAENF